MNIQEAVTKKLKLFTNKRVVTALDGNYDSIFRGRGIELESLREYVAGDPVRDIDWASYARTGKIHTRKYTALRDQRILLVPDTSSSMVLKGHTGLNKQDAAYSVAVMLGAFVKKNRDLMAVSMRSDTGDFKHSKYNNTHNHLESILQKIDKSLMRTDLTPVLLNDLLHFTLSTTKKRSALFIVSDAFPDYKAIDENLKRATKRHMVFFMQLAPSWPFTDDTNGDLDFYDIESRSKLVKGLSLSAKLQDEWIELYKQDKDALAKRCHQLGVVFDSVEQEEQTAAVLQKMFIQARRYARAKG